MEPGEALIALLGMIGTDAAQLQRLDSLDACITLWRARTADRPVKRERATPTMTAANAPRTSDATTEPRPPRKNHGTRGTNAPTPKLTNDDTADSVH